MAYNVGTTVELHGKISASSDTSVTVSCYEMLVGTDYVRMLLRFLSHALTDTLGPRRSIGSLIFPLMKQ